MEMKRVHAKVKGTLGTGSCSLDHAWTKDAGQEVAPISLHNPIDARFMGGGEDQLVSSSNNLIG
jgi:hypothetical protein